MLQHKLLLFYSGFFPCAHIFKGFHHFLPYKFHCLWFYVEFLDPLRFDLSTVEWNRSIRIFLHDNCQLCQHHLLKMLSLCIRRWPIRPSLEREAHWTCKLYMPQYRGTPGPRSESGWVGEWEGMGDFWDSIGNVNAENT